jgi:deazaflavin-dependent oxidoreductase (nitroreductase family)
MSYQDASMMNRIRFFNKRVTNRVTMKIAGLRYSPISIIRHVGRRSGKTYQTPVIVEPAADGFVFALTYGPDVDWYRNILAAGRATMRWHAKEYALEKSEPIECQAALRAFPQPFRFILRLVGPRHYFRMKQQN